MTYLTFAPLLFVLPLVGQPTTRQAPQANIQNKMAEDSSIAELRAKSEKGNLMAQAELGFRYKIGDGVPKDLKKAIYWMRKSAEQGPSPAWSDLASCYFHGQGVPQSYPTAIKWYRKSAKLGMQLDQFNLGLCYAKGLGVQADLAEAYAWFKLSAEGGNPKYIKAAESARILLSQGDFERGEHLVAEYAAEIASAKERMANGETYKGADQ